MVNDRIPDYSISSEISDKPKTQRKTQHPQQNQAQANVFDELNERLGATLYQYITLYERWSEDRQSFAKRGSELMGVLEALQKEIKNLGAMNHLVRQHLAQELQPVIESTKAAIAEVATLEAKKSLTAAAQQLQQSANELRVMLNQSKNEIVQSRYQWFGFTLLAAVIISILTIWVSKW